MFVLAIITGIATIFLYYLIMNATISLTIATILQLGLLVLTILAKILYRGPKKRGSYDGGWYKIWTIRYGLIMLSLLGNMAVFIVFVLNLFGFMEVF
ncbi:MULTISPECIES: hypothetical protein [Enterococcus]|uniref:hypothetical protein n=1 Tax=Enterococcus TaxID=1350 RepID=UPI00065E2022|nr:MULTISPECIES: hypothetical protein [Enterococcus]KAF1300180.1 hypothetical protein BAU16_13115 [Enterococcus sp. JM9B]